MTTNPAHLCDKCTSPAYYQVWNVEDARWVKLCHEHNNSEEETT